MPPAGSGEQSIDKSVTLSTSHRRCCFYDQMMIDGRRTRAALWRHSGKGRAVPEPASVDPTSNKRAAGFHCGAPRAAWPS